MIIAVDFDGTCVTHEFPKVGNEVGAVPVLKELSKQGHQLILWTMRSNTIDNTGFSDEVPVVHNGDFLDDAISWFKQYDIQLYGIQRNPTQDSWTSSPKCYAHIYIDDAALGCPLRQDLRLSTRPFVDWVEVYDELTLRGILKNTFEERNNIVRQIKLERHG